MPKAATKPSAAASSSKPSPKPKAFTKSKPTAKAKPKAKGEATYSATNDYRADPSSYRVGRGERGVLTCQPYKDEILPLWRFKTLPEAEESAKKIYAKFQEYQSQGDFVGQDLARKFLQMGYTRAMRYYNNKGGTKPAGTTEGRTNYRSASRKAKAEAADDSDGEEEDGGGEKEEKEAAFVPTGEVAKKDCAEAFKVYWRRVVDEDEVYGRMKKDWMKNEGKSAKEEVE